MMSVLRYLFLCSLLGLTAGCTTKGEVKPTTVSGAWAGKWDETWPVFFVIEDAESPVYRVSYIWKEEVNGPYSIQKLKAKGNSAEIQSDYLRLVIEKSDPNRAVAYGDFKIPRIAYLKRIPLSQVEALRNGESVIEP
jgi:hypothetical protein